jgi:hypothetical protein
MNPHPLDKFSSNRQVKHNVPAQIILDFIQDATLEAPDSGRAMGALWFLLESERVFSLRVLVRESTEISCGII